MDSQGLGRTIAAAQRGSAQAFAQLLDIYGPRLYGYFYRATLSPHDSEDLLGEITLRLVRRLKGYDERGRFEPWLFRIAANLVRDRIRRLKAVPGLTTISAGDDEGGTLADDLAADLPPTDQNMHQAEQALELDQALAKLDDTTRQMILLRHFGDMSFKEIAELFDCPLGTALAKVHRGLRAMQKMMVSP